MVKMGIYRAALARGSSDAGICGAFHEWNLRQHQKEFKKVFRTSNIDCVVTDYADHLVDIESRLSMHEKCDVLEVMGVRRWIGMDYLLHVLDIPETQVDRNAMMLSRKGYVCDEDPIVLRTPDAGYERILPGLCGVALGVAFYFPEAILAASLASLGVMGASPRQVSMQQPLSYISTRIKHRVMQIDFQLRNRG